MVVGVIFSCCAGDLKKQIIYMKPKFESSPSFTPEVMAEVNANFKNEFGKLLVPKKKWWQFWKR